MIFPKFKKLNLVLIGLAVLFPGILVFSGSPASDLSSNTEGVSVLSKSATSDTRKENPYLYGPSTVVYSSTDSLLGQYESSGREFKRLIIGNLIVYWHQRMVDDAIVQRNQIVYQFDKDTKALVKKIIQWREDLPEHLPPLLITKEGAESIVRGEVQYSNLFYISPESVVFPIKPTPLNPCWIVTSIDNKNMIVTIIDAVEGRILGYGVPPPYTYTAFSLTGPESANPCGGAWNGWYLNAKLWFDAMGYPTDAIEWPTEAQVKSRVQDNNIVLFYELAHSPTGDSTRFASGCVGGNDYEWTTAAEVESWIAGYNKKQFTFLGSCSGMCTTGSGTLSNAFRKGSSTSTTTVGYCGMSGANCATYCWDTWEALFWQDDLFEYMSWNWPVKTAFDAANAEYPNCANYNCMRFAGDPSFAVKNLAKFSKGDTVEVYNTGGVGLWVLGPDDPCGSKIVVKPDGARGMVLVDGPYFCGGYSRWKIRWGDDALEGWSAENWLKEIYITPSTKFSIGDKVKVNADGVNVRSDPPELAQIGTVNSGDQGTVIGGPFYGVPKVNGGFYHFWKIDYDAKTDGWTAEHRLDKVSSVCQGTDTSCGIYPNCVNCNSQDGCSGDYYYNYYCMSNSQGCNYTSDNCNDCSCSCGGYNIAETIANGNCNDGKDNDCDGKTDATDSGCISGSNPGDLCNSNDECASKYCEGSLSHPKRCCKTNPPVDGWQNYGDLGPGCSQVNDPTAQYYDYYCDEAGEDWSEITDSEDCDSQDGWYGGGNTAGCGDDPSSQQTDYYANSAGSCVFTTTNCGTKDCDSQDDCTTHCSGNNVVGSLDYYVITNTNTCTSTGGGVVEDCTAKTSTDTDGGNFPLIFGILTDYNTCSTGACTGTNYNDKCQSETDLLEYFSNLASYLTQNWLCSDSGIEKAASDPYGDDPTHTETCTAGKGATCSSGQFNLFDGASGTDKCQGTCGTGPNSCVFVEYYPSDSTDACPGLDTCTSKTYDADTNSNTCNECKKGANFWNLGGDVANCCGDDNSEYKTTRVCEPDACVSDPTDDACCIATDKCVYGSMCYENGYKGDPDDDLKNERCNNGVWFAEVPAPELYLPANNSVYIDKTSLFFDWSSVPSANQYELTISHPTHGVFVFNPTESEYLLEGAEWDALKDGNYTWKVSAVVGGEKGLPSEEWTFIKLTTPTLISPDDKATYAYIIDYLTAIWENTGAEKYKIKIVLPKGNIFEQTTAEPKYPIPPNLWNSLPDGIFTWSVASKVCEQQSDFSTPRAVIKKTIPVLLSPYDWAKLGLGDQTFDWEDVKNAVTYFAKVTIPGKLKPTEFQIPDGKSEWTILAKGWDPLPKGDYTWQVKSKKDNYESKYCEPWHFMKTK